MGMIKGITQTQIQEDLRYLADSMSTRAALAKKIGISQAYLHDVIAGKRTPGPKVLKFLKLEKRVVYVPTREEAARPAGYIHEHLHRGGKENKHIESRGE